MSELVAGLVVLGLALAPMLWSACGGPVPEVLIDLVAGPRCDDPRCPRCGPDTAGNDARTCPKMRAGNGRE